MAELKRNFTRAKMNKDADDRIVPRGEYRDAKNIEISTSEGSDVGTAQTLLGNIQHYDINGDGASEDSLFSAYNIPDTARVVGSVASPKHDKIYYFCTNPKGANVRIQLSDTPIDGKGHKLWKDWIMQYDPITETLKYVFVDIYRAITRTSGFNSPGGSTIIRIPAIETDVLAANIRHNSTGIRIGMTVVGSNIAVGTKVSDIKIVTESVGNSDNYYWNVHLDTPIEGTILENSVVRFEAENVLNFSSNNSFEINTITAINVVDDFIYWTDNHTEPKKINWKRSILGTGGIVPLINGSNDSAIGTAGVTTNDTFFGERDSFHTRLVLNDKDSDSFKIATNYAITKPVYVEEQHV